EQAERQLEQNVFQRAGNLWGVRRFVGGWILLLLLLICGLFVQNANLSKYYRALKPVPGGIYNEGVLGTFTNANPLYATNDADTSVSRLVFAGLFTYSSNNKLV